ncbi:Thermolabile hemolysin-like protein [Emericellopsis cladophorae]|uniref:Thermolabile hemolysin-like protein n=1 Tax=Emericellopsis cladophorae TaxID=2686198 RepID=A0A9P9Y1K6_9HYPO|nr:Thermolabile hemolysin-like protein [Emericellopsis cladophorae]KAI6781478.1 Thermolabile hemolysin-like protein [Emericellopsis cladophorae]
MAAHTPSTRTDASAEPAGWVFLMNALILQTCIFHDGYLVTALGSPVTGPMNLGSDSSMKLSLALIKTSFTLTLYGFATGWLHWVVVVVTVVTDAAYMSHAVLVWRANCGVEDSYTFAPRWPMDSGIWMNMIGSIISAVGDLVLSLVPAAVVWKLQMVRREKIGMAAAMAIGILAGAVAIMKAVEAPRVATTVGTDCASPRLPKTTLQLLIPVRAVSYKLARLSILVHAEPNAALIAASIPVLRILVRDSNRDVKGTQLRTVAAEADNDSEMSILPLQDIELEQSERSTVLYHGGRQAEPPSEPERLAFEIEHAENFGKSRREHQRPPPMGRPDGFDKAEGPRKPLMPPYEGHPGPTGSQVGYFHTYVATRDLNVLYFDGMSAGKTDLGTLDSQDLLLRAKSTTDNGFMDERERANDLCDIVTTYDGLGGNRLSIDFSSIVSGFFFPINISSTTDERPDLIRLAAASELDSKGIKDYLQDISMQARRFTVHWQGVVDMVVARYADRFALMGSDNISVSRFISELESLTLTYLYASGIKDSDVGHNHEARNETEAAMNRYSDHYLQPVLIDQERWSLEDDLIYTSLQAVMDDICYILYTMRSTFYTYLGEDERFQGKINMGGDKGALKDAFDTGFEISREKPSAANPFGNPPLPGWTSSGGFNWVGYMVSLYNTSTVLSYNFAYGGATVDSDIIAPYDPSVVSFKEQVAIFSDNLVPQPDFAPWTADSSIVGIWIGVNDIGNSWWEATRDDIYDSIMAVYSDQLQILYDAGLRDFFLLNVPPTDKTPLMTGNGQPMIDAIADFNLRVEALLDDFKAANEGVRGVVVDTHAPFNEAINNPQRYGAPDAMCVSTDGGCIVRD